MAALPVVLTENPAKGLCAVNADILSDVLQAVRLKGAVFFDVDARAPWVAETPPAKVIAPAVMPRAEHVIEYHVVTRGGCWAQIAGETDAPVRLEAGDVVAFPQGDAHILSSAPGMRGDVQLGAFEAPPGVQLPLVMNLSGDGEGTKLVCGFLGCDARPFNPLLQSLPRMLHVRPSPDSKAPTEAFMQFALLETREQRVGAAGMLSRLGELMFGELVRRHIETMPEDGRGWLAGLRDRHVGKALAVLHADPGKGWTLESLAREAGLSRSAFTTRFSGYIGMAPMQYLTRWRLQLAASQLSQSDASIAIIAERAGYESEAAFNRAFRKAVGLPPAAWRNRHRD
jgi:AraC-like DNA-binding protein